MNQNSSEQMKYIEITQAGGPEVLKVVQGKKPEIKEDEVLIEVYATGINRPDILQRQGLYPMPKGVTQIPGLEVAGIISKIGSKVRIGFGILHLHHLDYFCWLACSLA